MVRGRDYAVGMAKPRVSPEGQLRAREGDFGVDAGAPGDPPWWMPENLEVMQKELSSLMVKDLFDNGYFDDKKPTLAVKRRMTEHILFSCVRYPGFREQLARHMLMKPFEAMKHMGALMPKNVKIEGDVNHRFSIVVPATATPEEWDQTHGARKQLADGDWATSLEDTPFAQHVVTDVEVEE